MKSRRRQFPWRTFRLDQLAPVLDARRARPWAGLMARRREAGLPEVFSVLDLGTTHLKALVCRRSGPVVEVLGQYALPYGIQGQTPSGMAELCNQALTEAENQSALPGGRSVVPDEVVIGVPASTVAVRSSMVTYRRRDPSSPMDAAELERILYIGQRTALEELWGSRLPFSDAVLLASGTQIMVAVDGHPADDPRGLRGEMVTLTLCNLAASKALLHAMSRLADALELTPCGFIVPAQAMVHVLGRSVSSDGVGIDMGGRRSVVVCWRQGIVRGWASFPIGGQDFTLAIQRAYHLDGEKAERLKCWYGEGRLSPDHGEGIRQALRATWELWKDGLIEALKELSMDSALPGHIWLWGGGARLHGAVDAVRMALNGSGLPFEGYPQVRAVELAGMRNLRLPSGADPLASPGYALALSFALRAEENELNSLLRRTTEAVCRSKSMEVWTTGNEQE